VPGSFERLLLFRLSSSQVAVEAILLWTKALFFGLAVDGLGTFI
jgi:hypothetical protein